MQATAEPRAAGMDNSGALSFGVPIPCVIGLAP